MDSRVNVQAWRFSHGPLQYDVVGGDAPRRWRGLTRDQTIAALRLLGCSSTDATDLVTDALSAAASRVPAPATLWVAHLAEEPALWQHRIGVHVTNASARDQVDSWIEDHYLSTPAGAPPEGLTQGQRRDRYAREVPHAPIRVVACPRPAHLRVTDTAPVASRHRISSVDVEVVGWWGPGGNSCYDIDGGGPPRQWLGLNEAQAHAALVMLGCRPGEAAEAVEVAGRIPALLPEPPARAVVWVALIAAGPEIGDPLVTLHASQEEAQQHLEAWLASRTDLDDVDAFRSERCLVEHRLVLP